MCMLGWGYLRVCTAPVFEFMRRFARTASPFPQVVTWTVFYPPNFIGPYQLKLFRYLHRLSKDNEVASWRRLNNRRPLQPLNDRHVQVRLRPVNSEVDRWSHELTTAEPRETAKGLAG